MAQLGCLIVIIGIIVGVGGVIAMLTTDVGIPVLEVLFCPENDTLIRETTPTFQNESVRFYCVDDGGARTSINSRVIFLALGLVAVIPVGLLMMVIGGLRQPEKMRPEDFKNSGMTIRSYTVRNSLSDFDDMLGPLMEKARRVNASNQMTLKEKLGQLQEAYDEGLIDLAEFEKRKVLILDELVED